MKTTIDINKFIFTRTAPKKKLEVIEKLSNSELLGISEETVQRIIKEAGSGKKGSPNKNLIISRKNKTGNHWNSDVEEWYTWKKKVWMSFYLQYDNTDTSTDDTFKEFMKYSEYKGSYEYEDRYGNTQTTYYRYNSDDKAEAIKALLQEYIETKYQDKLKENVG